MIAFLAGLLFAFWLVVGYAVTSRLLHRRRTVPNLLLAPPIGLAITELTLFVGMRTGEPLKTFCLPLLVGLLGVAIISLLLARPRLMLRRYAPFVGILAVAFVLNGWPLFRYGQDWVGSCTHDMSMYCMAAESFKTHGVDPGDADLAEFDYGKDYGYPVRMWYLVNHVRRGTEISLGALSFVVDRQPTMVCMAFALAMQLALVSATGFLAHRYSQGRNVALCATALMAVSTGTTLGFLEQMLGQIGGLALLAAGVGILGRPARCLPLSSLAHRVLLGGIVCGALALHYTEVLPFLLASVGGITAIGLLRRRNDWPRLAVVLLSLLSGIGLLGQYGIDVLEFLARQLTLGRGGTFVLNQYHEVYRSARGLFLIWGTQARVDYPEVTESIHGLWSWTRLIFGVTGLGMCLSCAAILSWRQRAAWVVFCGMSALGFHLYQSHAWYGLHKLGMYIQPFLATVVASLVLAAPWRVPRYLAMSLFIGLLATNAAAQYRYVRESTRLSCCFPNAARTGLVSEMQAVRTLPTEHVYVAVENLILSRFLTIPIHDREAVMTMAPFWKNTPQLWPSMKFPENPVKTGDERIDSDPLYRGTPDWLAAPSDRDYLIVAGQRLTSLNRARYAGEKPTNVQFGPIKDFHNHLIFRESRLSMFSYPGVRDDLEKFAPEAAIAAITPVVDFDETCGMYLGSHLTLQVINPSPRIRLVFSASANQPEWNGQLPEVKVYGRSSLELGFGGIGSGRIISPAIEPALEGNLRTLRLDLARKSAAGGPSPTKSDNPNATITLCRDLSVISEEEYQRYVPPRAIDRLGMLRNHPLLEYSGLYDDGWMGSTFRTRLTSTDQASELAIRGVVPEIYKGDDFRTDMIVSIDGVEKLRKTLAPGNFEVRVPETKPGPRWIEFRFSRTRRSDARSVVARLEFVGFDTAK